MLADSFSRATQIGSLGNTVQVQATFLYELLNFISKELPNWRDRADRNEETAETMLTAQLCAHLTGASRRAKGWDILQFRAEVPDQEHKARRIDLVPSACDCTIYVDGRRCTEFDTLLPIECKRLPTPKEKKREECEYVVTHHSTTGGIQRFKEGHHGSRHRLGAMIAYIQKGTAAAWHDQITTWIEELANAGKPGWSSKDFLALVSTNPESRISTYRSINERTYPLPEIELHHLWLEMQ